MKPIRWGMIGGGQGSQVGALHRYAAALDGQFELVSGAFDHRETESVAFGVGLGLSSDRAYGSWQQMLENEASCSDPVQMVTVATPNYLHYEITKAFLEAGIHVLCEKPLTVTVAEAAELMEISERTGSLCGVNFGYTGYPLVREMRSLVRSGKLGDIKLVKCNFSHGHHADANAEANDRVRWRYTPEYAGISGQFIDCGIHALHLASFVSGLEPKSVNADLASIVPSRQLDDDAMVNVRFENGAVGRIWTSSVAIGRQHGLEVEVYGTLAGMRWRQELPNQLFFSTLDQRTTIIERGAVYLSEEAKSSNRVTVGHAEGIIEAFANIYLGMATCIRNDSMDREQKPDAFVIPTAQDGWVSMRAAQAAVSSNESGGLWVDV